MNIFHFIHCGSGISTYIKSTENEAQNECFNRQNLKETKMGLDTLLNQIGRMTWHADVTGNNLSQLLALCGLAQFPYSNHNYFNG